jgi:hypothetical protein
MTLELLQAIQVVFETCLEQDSCSNCPFAQFCGKMPCEW